jgi:cysteine desulfurase
MSKPIAYLDNNATTIMSRETVREMVTWCNCGNPSAAYSSALKCREMIADFHAIIARHICAPPSAYDIVFTSGATEANNMICRGIIETRCCMRDCNSSSFHVVCSAIEHDSIRLLMDGLMRSLPDMTITYVNPNIAGHIDARTFARAVRDDTILAICMLANNETGAINDISAICAAVHARNAHTFFHCDIVQGFAKIPIDLLAWGVDGASISFHKIHGPPGVGAAIARKSVMCAHPLLYGMQNNKMRGGTENVPGIGAARYATVCAIESMYTAFDHEIALKQYLIAKLREHVVMTRDIVQYMSARKHSELELVIIGNISNLTRYLPGTIMIAAAKHIGPPACNTLIRNHLETIDNVIVSIGSACNTESAARSHVLVAMGIPPLVMDGSIRVSLCAQSTRVDIDRFIVGFLREVKRQYDITRTSLAEQKK